MFFLKEPHIDTDRYTEALNGSIPTPLCGNVAADTLLQSVSEAVNRFMMHKAEQDIYKAFEQAETELQYLRQLTREGLATAKLNGKQLGAKDGQTFTTKKSIAAKEVIKKHSVAFGGSLNDIECMKLAGIARNTFYKYKKELINAAMQGSC